MPDDFRIAAGEQDNTLFERLRASKKQAEEEDYRQGQKSGEKWAKNHANWRELRRLDREFGHWSVPEGEEFFSDDCPSPCPCCYLSWFLMAMDPEKFEGDDVAQAEFWILNAGDKYPEPDFVRGFCEGALEVHDEVRREETTSLRTYKGEIDILGIPADLCDDLEEANGFAAEEVIQRVIRNDAPFDFCGGKVRQLALEEDKDDRKIDVLGIQVSVKAHSRQDAVEMIEEAVYIDEDGDQLRLDGVNHRLQEDPSVVDGISVLDTVAARDLEEEAKSIAEIPVPESEIPNFPPNLADSDG